MRENITILHTNDLHSHLERWPKIRRFILSQQQNLRRDGFTVLTFDIGDALDRIHPLTEATMGQGNVALLNEIGYDGVTIGNNEGLSFAHATLNHLYDTADFPVVVANVIDAKTGKLPKWAQPYKIITTDKGTRIGVIGLTAPYTLTYELLDWDPLTVGVTLRQVVQELAGQTDFNILLSHLGLLTDRKIAEDFPEIQVVLGAHTHHHLPHGEKHGNSILAAAGKYGDHIGKVELEIEDGQLIHVQARTIETDALPEIPSDRVEINSYLESGDDQLEQQVLAVTQDDYLRDLEAQNRLIDLGLKALEKRTKTDLAMLSTGLFLTDMPKGRVTLKTVHTMLPHAVHAMRSTLLGSDVVRLMREVKKTRNFLIGAEVKGMGFRGRHWGEIVWDGLELTASGDALVHGEPIDLDAEYTIGSLDHYLFFPYFPTLEIAGQNELSYDTVFREDFAQYLKESDSEF
jgi:2',3'-cyclic-nucleotide 2'-phosphodiesterase (5'-nucleotidase family)